MKRELANFSLSSRRSLFRWTLETIRRYGIRPSKKKDQHFLIHPKPIRDILSRIDYKDECLEVGTGLGTLTIPLSEIVKRVISVEIDAKLTHTVSSYMPSNVLTIVGDGVVIARSSCIKLLVSNSPYSISSVLVVNIAKNNCIKEALIVLQKELALRAIAPPGETDYSRFSLITQRYFNVELISVYPASYFYPRPLVNGALISLKRKRNWEEGDEAFEQLITCLFSGRRKLARKMVKRCLGLKESVISWLGEKRVKDLSLMDIERILEIKRSES